MTRMDLNDSSKVTIMNKPFRRKRGGIPSSKRMEKAGTLQGRVTGKDVLKNAKAHNIITLEVDGSERSGQPIKIE